MATFVYGEKRFFLSRPRGRYVPGLPTTQRKLREDGAEKRLSQALVALRVPHRPDVLLCHDTYKVENLVFSSPKKRLPM